MLKEGKNEGVPPRSFGFGAAGVFAIGMKSQNFQNRTLWIGDNLDVLRGIDDEVTDLIYLDPPFNSKRIYHAPLGSKAAEASFDDTWKLDDVKREWTDLQEHAEPAVWHSVQGAGLAAGDSMKAYLAFMAARLPEMHRVLRSTGALLLHCDPHASHYLKQLLDCVFGASRFRNEIVWKRTSTKDLGARRFVRDGDRILYYTKSSTFTWHPQYQPHNPEYVTKSYKYDDNDGRGRWSSSDLTGGKAGGPEAYLPFKGVLPSAGRAWAPPQRDKFPDSVGGALPDDYESMNAIEKCHALDRAGAIHWTGNGKPRVKRYLSAMRGMPASDMILDINPVASGSTESTGWRTQKPLKLLRRIILATTNPGDMVLDPFAGCATTCVAAEMEGRMWAGIDLDSMALEVTVDRLKLEAEKRNEGRGGTGQLPGFEWDPTTGETVAPTVLALETPPRRTDPDRPKRTPNSRLRLMLWAQLGKHSDGRGICPGCERPKYQVDYDLDHITPRAKGGQDIDDNIQLLCHSCNLIKGGTSTMKGLREKLIMAGVLRTS